MGRVNTGDMICIKNPERHSLVKAGKLLLKAPDHVSMIVPEGTSLPDLRLLESLADWNIIVVNEESVCQPSNSDPLIAELINEYDVLKVADAIEFISGLSATNQKKFIDYERVNKNRLTVLRTFEGTS
jgi:hypothetical protein